MPDTNLTFGQIDSGSYGRYFNGTNDTDGLVTAGFTVDGTPEDLVLSFDGYDIDTDTELRIIVNGVDIGAVAKGKNNGLASYTVTIPASLLQSGYNEITFMQSDNIAYKWGVTDILLEPAPPPPPPDMTLTMGELETGSYGLYFNGANDTDGLVTAGFTVTGTPEDLVLRFDGYDIDTATELRIIVNGTDIGAVAKGVNNGLAAYTVTISASLLQTGDNVITFKQADNIAYKWGVTNILLEPVPPPLPEDMTLTLGELETGSYGLYFNGTTDDDGQVEAYFSVDGAPEDLVLSFDGYDIDTATELRIIVNGTDIGAMAAGVNDGLASYSLTISAGLLQTGANVIVFQQSDNIAYKWGVTNVLLEPVPPPPPPDMTLTMGELETGSYGLYFNGANDTDGLVTAGFTVTGTPEDLLLRFDGYDIDTATELRIIVNGTDIGAVAKGVNDGLAEYFVTISAGLLQTGDNVITFKQADNVAYKWGVTNVLLEPAPLSDQDMDLTLGQIETAKYGQSYAGVNDADGLVHANFTVDGTPEDLVLRFDGYDIDTATELRITVNGVDLGPVAAGVNNGLAQYEIRISAALLQSGDNVIVFQQSDNIAYTWGVTNILLDLAPPPEFTLALDVPDTGTFGQNFAGATDSDGEIRAGYAIAGAPEDVVLTFDGYDIDTASELQVFINDVSVGFVAAGQNNGLMRYELAISTDLLNSGNNTILFKQAGSTSETWGITNVLVTRPPAKYAPSDTLYGEQWHLAAIGDIERIWADYTGTSVAVGIYDNGVQYTHHDLDSNYDASKHVVVDGQVLDPMDGTMEHGTAVAGIIAASNDSNGAVGVAFDASITGVNIITGVAGPTAQSVENFAEALMQMSNFDVVNNSWGWEPPFTPDDPPPADFYNQTLPTLQNAADNGRVVDGEALGTNIVKSAGNSGTNAQGDKLNASRYTITVGAVGEDGKIASYSNWGSNMLVSAPSSNGDIFFGSGILTTDLLGAAGYAAGDYTGADGLTGFGGTSAAAPIVTGVVALMLDANPYLGWRDVQSILAYSSTHTGTNINRDPVDDDPFGGLFVTEKDIWEFNGADNWNGGGLHVSEDYGLGLVNVYNAVRMAEVWSYFGGSQTSANESVRTASSAQPVVVGFGADIGIAMTGPDFQIESVHVSAQLSDASVDLFLVSPDGTRVQLYDGSQPATASLDWTFGAQMFRGESLEGTWTLEIDNADGDSAQLLGYEISFYGREDGANGYDAADDVYHYTDEIFDVNIFDLVAGTTTAAVDDPARTTLEDLDGGIDWLNFAAMTSPLAVDLGDGGGATAGGRTIIDLAPGSVIENVVGGDGYDSLMGNDAGNHLLGMRGNDILFGLDGDDRLEGGRGNDAMVGGGGDDMFVFRIGDGDDWIADFDLDGNDQITLEGFGSLTFADLSFFSDVNLDTVLSLSASDSLTFAGGGYQFTSDDFIFV